MVGRLFGSDRRVFESLGDGAAGAGDSGASV